MKIKLFAIICCLLIPCYHYATSIIIMVVGNSIYAASDSKSTLTDLYSGKPMGSKIIKKIFVKNNIGFAVSGHCDTLLKQKANASIVSGRDIDACAESFGNQMCKAYIPLMQIQKIKTPKVYSEYLHNALGAVVFFQVKDSKPVMHLVELIMSEHKGQTIISYKIYKNQMEAYLGFKDHIIGLPSEQMQKIMLKYPGTPDVLCGGLVQTELSNHKEYIGCPIITLSWSPIGIKWGSAPCQ